MFHIPAHKNVNNPPAQVVFNGTNYVPTDQHKPADYAKPKAPVMLDTEGAF